MPTTPAGAVVTAKVIVGQTTALTTKVNTFVPVQVPLVAVTVNVPEAVAVVGIPEITPAGVIVTPPGNAPALMLYV